MWPIDSGFTAELMRDTFNPVPDALATEPKEERKPLTRGHAPWVTLQVQKFGSQVVVGLAY